MNTKEENVLYQIALFQSVAQGEYYGAISVGDLKKHGDFGMGIFDHVDGELIMNNGVVYQALFDGSVVIPSDDVMVPYADVTFFRRDYTIEGVKFSSMKELADALTGPVLSYGKNQFYYAKLHGQFSSVLVRSELKQEEPFQMLNLLLRTDQRSYAYENISGTIVGLYCPPYMGMLNAPGWHFHFISDDEKAGGHMLDAVSTEQGVPAEIAKMSSFRLDVPDSDTFNGKDLSLDVSAAIKEAEWGKQE